uniref:Uncharacterized protein n=1 Tax=Anopheles epiroticus TaxID=199890 RepID=A0A182PNK4_9DIPT
MGTKRQWLFGAVCLLTVLSRSVVQCFEHLTPVNDLLLPEFGYESDIERDLLPLDERSYFFHNVRSQKPEEHTFQSDYNLANLKPISPTPGFTLDPFHISPEDIFPARPKRLALLRRKPSKQRKREQQKELLEHEDDDEKLDEEDEEGKEANSDETAEVESTDVDDYAERYEQFIAKHFEDLESKRKKSAPQRKAPKSGKKAKDEDEDEEDEDGDYKFDRFDYSSSEDYERIKAESEEQSRQLAKDPKNCRTYEKDGMVCSVCHDPASDSASESCAYATEPHHRKYAYVKERNYDSKKDDPNREKAAEEEKDDEDDDELEHMGSEARPERQTDDAEHGEKIRTPLSTMTPRRLPVHPLRKPTLRSKPHQSATNGGGYRYQPTDLRSNRASMKLKDVAAADVEDVPGKPEDDSIYVMNYDNDPEEVAKVLAEFKARDWSNCRKGKRMDDGELTCYQCTDAAGVNHEECMYVSESRQIASEPVRPPPSMIGKLLKQQQAHKRKKVVALSRKELAALEPSASVASVPAKEKQTVKRTVSFRSYVTGSGRGEPASSSSGYLAHSGSDGDERVIHYEHHISHEVP